MSTVEDEREIENYTNNLREQFDGTKSLKEICASLSIFLGEEQKGRLEQARKRLEKEVFAPKGVSLRGTEVEKWYAGPSEADRHWPAVRDYLLSPSGKGWNSDVVDQLDRESSRVLSHFHNPSNKEFQTQGLVVGHVQSGKTANFCAVMAKAADYNFRFQIVLSGLTNSLRQQTQARLLTDLIGSRSSYWHTLTDLEHDYSDMPVKLHQHLNAPEQRSLAVIKKNVIRMERLRDDLQRSDVQKMLRDCPVLIIDDESDQASVNSNKNPQADPSKINDLLRQILACIPRVSYVGYTATPFANVLIDPNLEDLYPRDFILPLETPTEYFGAERIFGRDIILGQHDSEVEGLDVIREIPEVEVPLLSPPNSRAYRSFQPEVSPSLEDAVIYFLCVCAARVNRGQDHRHSTMLVHTDWHGVVHTRMRNQIRGFLDNLQRDWSTSHNKTVARFESVWNRERNRCPDPAGTGLVAEAWADLEPLMERILGMVNLNVENCESDTRIDFRKEEAGTPGIKSIVVGGNILARGLTVEGLSVSFFTRHARQDDSLMQMGRWFGYRQGYEDLPRIWMTEDLRRDFEHLARQEAEFRQELEMCGENGQTPLDFQPRVRMDPDRLPTSKIGAAPRRQSSFVGRHPQTTRFHLCQQDWLKTNWSAGHDLLQGCGVSPRRKADHLVYEQVSVDRILQFLNSYQFHVDHEAMHRGDLVRYVQETVSFFNRNPTRLDTMSRWNVVRIGTPRGSSAPNSLGPSDTKLINRSQLENDEGSIGALMSIDNMLIDVPEGLSIPDELSRSTSWPRRMSFRKNHNLPPLLLLYPIDRNSKPGASAKNRINLSAVDDVLGLGFCFPDHEHAPEYIQAPDYVPPVEKEDDLTVPTDKIQNENS